jgi:hypothetical protein
VLICQSSLTAGLAGAVNITVGGPGGLDKPPILTTTGFIGAILTTAEVEAGVGKSYSEFCRV